MPHRSQRLKSNNKNSKKLMRSQKMQKKKFNVYALMLLLPIALLTACAERSTIYVNASAPSLPEQARQKQMPPICLPSCSSNLIKWRENSQGLLMKLELED
jgi:hypothetical protein